MSHNLNKTEVQIKVYVMHINVDNTLICGQHHKMKMWTLKTTRDWNNLISTEGNMNLKLVLYTKTNLKEITGPKPNNYNFSEI